MLEFIFSSIWHFLGACILLGIVFDGLTNIITAIKGN